MTTCRAHLPLAPAVPTDPAAAPRRPRGRILIGVLLATVVFGFAGPGPAQAAERPEAEELAELQPLVDSAGYSGTVLVVDTATGRARAVHADRIHRRTIPASTFKILNALIALEVGAIAGPETVIPWDGVRRERLETNRDMTLAEAFRVSSLGHYQELARRIGLARMRQWVEACGYGNAEVGPRVDTFWLEGPLKISPYEQARFIARLMSDDLPFKPATMETVRKMMVNEATATYTIHAKTGWGDVAESQVGWWVGWVERDGKSTIFATQLVTQDHDADFGMTRQNVTKAVLQRLGVLPLATPAH